jgi:hypothetical protein
MLTESDAKLMALAQNMRLVRAQLEQVTVGLDEIYLRMLDPTLLDDLQVQILALKYIIDFTLGETKP